MESITSREFRSLKAAMITTAAEYSLRTTPLWRKQHLRVVLAKLFFLYRKLPVKYRSMWVKPIFTPEQRFLQGDSDNLIKLLQNTDTGLYYSHLRMTPDMFEELLAIVGPKIEKQTVVREPISPRIRLQLCLRYLAIGDKMSSVGRAFRVSAPSVSSIIEETCTVIWEELSKVVMPTLTNDTWKEVAQDFESLWQFPNCIGAIDGKHMKIEAPPGSGSVFRSYKHSFSFVLTAVCDAYSRFIYVYVGAEGRRSDGGIFESCSLKHGLKNMTINVPELRMVGNSRVLPYVLVGDEAYALTRYMMTPYPRSNELDLKKKVYNYRHSRCRRSIECTFGIFVQRWRVFRDAIIAEVETGIKMFLAGICLHNFCINHKIKTRSMRYRTDTDSQADRRVGLNNSAITQEKLTQAAIQKQNIKYRNEFSEFFMNEGAVDWQWNKAQNNDF